MDRAEQWKNLCQEKGWLQEDRVVAPPGFQLFFAFRGVGTVPTGGGTAAPGFFVASDLAHTSHKEASSSAQSVGEFLIAKPEKGYNVSVWSYYLWEDVVSIQLLKVVADRVV